MGTAVVVGEVVGNNGAELVGVQRKDNSSRFCSSDDLFACTLVSLMADAAPQSAGLFWG